MAGGKLDLDETRGRATYFTSFSLDILRFLLRNRRLAIVHHIKAADFYRANTCFDEATDRCLLKVRQASQALKKKS